MSDLLKEAIADAHKVKEIAYENARAAIEEAFQPKIQRMISTKLAEEDFEDDEMSFEEDPAAVPPVPAEPSAEPEFAPAPEEEEEEEMFGESYIDDGKNGTPDNPIKNSGRPQLGLDEEEIDEEFERIIRELEAEEDEFNPGGEEEEVVEGKKKDAAYDQTASKSRKNLKKTMGESEYPEDDMAQTEPAEDNLEDLNLEALISKLEEEEFGTAPKSSTEVAALRTEVARLRKQNKQAFRVISELKSTMNEVNLLNSKLMYSSKILRAFDLTEAQQVKVLETLDRAQSIREAKLIFTTIHEHYTSKKNVVRNTRAQRSVNESASRTIPTVKSNKTATGRLMEGAERWQEIAGIKPLKD